MYRSVLPVCTSVHPMVVPAKAWDHVLATVVLLQEDTMTMATLGKGSI